MKGIDYFNRGHWLTSVQENLSLKTRRKMYELWKPAPSQKVLDIGATPDCERLDSNCFLPWILSDGHSLSAVSPEDISELKDKYPAIIILNNLDVPDNSYDWVFSSAVLEHVGNTEKQIEFIKECARVGKGIFLTTPNRCHWLEFHTKLPFIHWLPKKLHRAILKALGMEFWSREENLNLMTKRDLSMMASTMLRDEFQFEIKTVWALGMPSNLILIAKRLNR